MEIHFVGTGVLDGPFEMPLRGRTVREASPYKRFFVNSEESGSPSGELSAKLTEGFLFFLFT